MSYFPLTSFQRSYQISSSLFMVPFKKAPEASSRIPCWKFGISESSRKVWTCTATEWTQRKHLGSSLSLCFSSSCVFQVVRVVCSELIWYIRRNLIVSTIVPHRKTVDFDLRAEKYNIKKHVQTRSTLQVITSEKKMVFTLFIHAIINYRALNWFTS